MMCPLGSWRCHNAEMQNIDFKKWFDRMQPQTLQIATWLLYFDGFFALVSLIDKSGYLGYLRFQYPFGFLLGLISVALYASGGLLMANDLKLRYKLAVLAAASPFRIVRLAGDAGRRPLLDYRNLVRDSRAQYAQIAVTERNHG